MDNTTDEAPTTRYEPPAIEERTLVTAIASPVGFSDRADTN